MLVDVRTHLDLFDVLRLLRLALGIGLFLGLIFELADIQELRDRRVRVRGYFDQIEANGRSLLDRVARVQHAEILALAIDDANGVGLNKLIEARSALGRGRHRTPSGGSYSKVS